MRKKFPIASPMGEKNMENNVIAIRAAYNALYLIRSRRTVSLRAKSIFTAKLLYFKCHFTSEDKRQLGAQVYS